MGPALTLVAALAAPPLADWNAGRIQRHDAGMWTLLGWGGLSAAVGGAGWAASGDPQWRAFHQMTLGWGVINAGIAGLALASTRQARARAQGPAESLTEHHALRRALLLNAGLDVAYLAVGGWLWERGGRAGDPRQVGFGQAIVIQGAWLLAFDLTLDRVMAQHGDRLSPILLPGGAGLAGRF